MLDLAVHPALFFLDPVTLLCMVAAMAYGILMGAIPGLTATMAVALLLPLTYNLPSGTAIAMFVAVYIGGISGGLIPAMLLRMPGTPASVSTVFDGYPMAQKGEAARALGLGIQASFIGGTLGALALALIAPPLARFAVTFGPFEYAALTFLALSMVAAFSDNHPLRGLLSALLGLLLACVGMSPIDGTRRFTFGFSELNGGFEVLSVLIGLFAISELLHTCGSTQTPPAQLNSGIRMREIFPPWRKTLSLWRSYLRASCIGTLMGILPGIGGGPGGLMAYAQEKKASSHPERFGTGVPEGVIASEAANNAVTGGALIPMLTLGIPGDATTAVIMGGFILHGVRPGPLLFQNSPDIISLTLSAVFLCNVMMLLMESLAIRGFVRVLSVPKHRLIPAIAVLCVVGGIGINNRLFDVWAMLGFGVLGYILERNRYPLAPLVLGFILGPMLEENTRRSLLFYDSPLMLFVERPMGTVMVLLALAPALFWLYRRRAGAQVPRDVTTPPGLGNGIFLTLLCAIALGLFYATFSFPFSMLATSSSPTVVPRVVLSAVFLISALLLTRCRMHGEAFRLQELFARQRLPLVLTLPVYVLIMPVLGFTLSTALLLFTLFSLLCPKKHGIAPLLQNGVLAAAWATGLYLLFKMLFYVDLPVNASGF